MCALFKVAGGGGRIHKKKAKKNNPQLAGKSLSSLAAADALNVTQHEAVTQIITAEPSHNEGLVIMQICTTGNFD